MTLQELLEDYQSDDEVTLTQSGTTQINGIDAMYYVYEDEDDYGAYTAVGYAVVSGSSFVEYVFYMDDTSANSTVVQIMNSLTY